MKPDELVQRGGEHEANGDLVAAEAAYREADNQGDAEGAILLGLVLSRRGDQTGAAEAFRRSEARGHPEAGACLGNLLSDAGDIDGAKAAYERSIAAGGKLARFNLGLMLAQNGADDEALPHLQAAERNGDAGASWAVGRVLENKGNLEGARAAYSRGADAGEPRAAFALGVVSEKLGDLAGARAAMQRANDLGHDGAQKVLAKMNADAEASARIAPLSPGEERLLQTVHRPDGNWNYIYLTRRRAGDGQSLGGGAPDNFIAIIRSTDDAQGDTSSPFAWRSGPTETSIYETVAEAFVNSGTLPGSTVTLEPDLQWFVDRLREQRGPTVSAAEATNKWAGLYAAACAEVMTTINACLEVANRAIGARNTAAQRPQHEISIRNFTTMAENAEREFGPLYQAFEAASSAAREAAAHLLASNGDPLFAEMTLAMAYEGQALDQIATAKGILGASFGPTPQTFIEGLTQANALIQNPPEEGNIYRAPAVPTETHGSQALPPDAPSASASSEERACPWCAETIKAAAIVCRFCGRDVNAQLNVG